MKQVFFLRDSWTSLALFLTINKCRPEDHALVARYVVHNPAIQHILCLTEERLDNGVTSAFFVGRLVQETAVPINVWVALPNLGQVFYDGTFFFSRLCQFELVRQYAYYCQIARLQTIGGGWASLKEATRAMQCAIEMFRMAMALGNDRIASNCRIYIAWGLLWSGKVQQAIKIFKAEKKNACMRGELEQQRRCENGIVNARTNISLRKLEKRTFDNDTMLQVQ